ncbi:type II toxin-antitoxin system RelB/DinJ family antitoxin, partial [Megasphaera sp.]
MDDVTREKARAVFARLGLTEEQAIELFYKRTIEAGRMPFAAA